MQILVRQSIVIDYCIDGYYLYEDGIVSCPSKGTANFDCTIVTVDNIPEDIDEFSYLYIGGKFYRNYSLVDPAEVPKKSIIDSGRLDRNRWDKEAKIYVLDEDYSSEQYDIEIAFNAEAATEAEYVAWSEAQIAGFLLSNTIKAYGEIPSIDIPIIIKVVSK